jgi:septal ring factor EnvC (AmiA/AmiB activator)
MNREFKEKSMFVRKFKLLICIFFIAFSFNGSLSFAKSFSNADLKKVKSEMKKEKEKKNKLDRDKRKVEGEIKNIQKKTVEIGKKISSYEKKLLDLELSLYNVSQEKSELNKKIDENKSAILEQAALLQGISETPFQLLMFNKELNNNTLESSIQLTAVLEYISILNTEFQGQIEQKQILEDQINQEKKEISELKIKILGKNKEIKNLLARKERSKKKIDSDSKKVSKKLKKLASKSKDIEDFIKKAMQKKREEARKKREAEARKKGKKVTKKKKTPASLKSFGIKKKMDYPVNGKIAIKYGQKKPSGVIAKGVYIKAKNGSQVSSPYDGTVLFAGDFKSYGNTLIIDHGNEYYSVLAGIGNTYPTEGQSLLAGEPVGKMNSKNRTLYMEFRHNDDTVNPSKFFK